jgi:hypothetical protein
MDLSTEPRATPRSCIGTELPAVAHQNNGGASRDRTDDLKLAKLPLSQLSYGPYPDDCFSDRCEPRSARITIETAASQRQPRLTVIA